MFLGLTKYALVLLIDYKILAYHELLSNDFGICIENDNILHMTVTSSTQWDEEHAQNSKFLVRFKCRAPGKRGYWVLRMI